MQTQLLQRQPTSPRVAVQPKQPFGSTFWVTLAEEVVITLAHSLVLFTGLGLTLYAIDPSRQKENNAAKHRKLIRKKMQENGRVPFEMSEHESIIALDLVYPEDISTKFADIGGLEQTKNEIFDLVCLPLQRLDLFSGESELIRPPKGILLYGPPGTGKTMMAKAIAKESSAAFINLKVSTLLDKWFGESEKLVRATFTLAWKLSPAIIFIDEIESFLKKRGNGYEHQAVSNMKAEFMSLWDGLNSNLFEAAEETKKRNSFFGFLATINPFSMVNQQTPADVEQTRRRRMFGVVVIGATNRPADIDEAVLRRMARTFCLDLPNDVQRLQIMQLVLRNESLTADVVQRLPHFCRTLEGYSGSDIKELCRAAAMMPLKELSETMKTIRTDNSQAAREDLLENFNITKVRKLQIADFEEAKRKVLATGISAKLYQRSLEQKEAAETHFNPEIFQQFLAAMFAGNASKSKQNAM